VVSLLAGHEFEATQPGILIAIVSGGIATALGYVVWYLALRELPVANAATVQLSMPALVALVYVALWLRRHLAWPEPLGRPRVSEQPPATIAGARG